MFDAESQFVDVGPGSGHEWQAPGPDDLRGECPGLYVWIFFYLLDYDDDGLIADVVVNIEMRLRTTAFCLVVVCFCQFGVSPCVSSTDSS